MLIVLSTISFLLLSISLFYSFVFMLGIKHEFVQSVDCTVQNVDLHFGQAILGLPAVSTIPGFPKQCSGDHTIIKLLLSRPSVTPAFEAECSSCFRGRV